MLDEPLVQKFVSDKLSYIQLTRELLFVDNIH